MENKDQYAVYGNPVKHSKSPQIHAAFAEQTGQKLNYRAHKVELERFAEVASQFFSHGGKGLNITAPFKLDAFKFADQLSGRARRAGAVNTLALQEDGSIYGDNTDGVGLVRDIHDNLGWELNGRRILVLGAGGAARGILGPVLKQKPAHVLVANRTVEKAQNLVKLFDAMGDVSGCSYEGLIGTQFDLIINGTSASMTGDLPPLPHHILSNDGCAYDMMYGPKPTPFMRWAAAEAAWAVSDGLGMLVEQAAESFCIWRGVRPDTKPVVELIRQSLSA
ncbi:Shikimate dehydrogenase (NADP(+)) [Zhongshania aliphaticivorans]|uniref:Shikimate dehydrogenase (NADP(+)) n=1 Tax=Zhongshania aliphaticivorans TaxID=1470434 RepID=A0A5S9PLJ5_9GAMM|nr:shikimate dehydrogenase [Zhongshania aliphaticivorans]CAA0104609.1 Shikimate dehydrogenase (NADP(+)) [Zhongshania aliphaticivorans]CAA0104869.1 Shikimate dehydrogenase (NADP(+)) [Zhongshania aliphaticivorans]